MVYPVADAVIVAAGQGSRMGAGHNKLLLNLFGETIIEKSVKTFLKNSHIRKIYVTVSAEDRTIFEDILPHQVVLVEGGKRRQDSVHQALLEIRKNKSKPDLVLVHDGARPFCSSKLIDRILQKASSEGTAIPVLPLMDTIRRITDKKTETVDRSELFVVQTPQAFKEELLFNASEAALKNNWNVTDDASLLENNGQIISTVEGEANNIKMTSPADLERAQWIMHYMTEITA